MRFFVGVTSAFGAGILIGLGLGAILTEEKYRKEYEESAASMRRAREMELKDNSSAHIIGNVEVRSWGPVVDNPDPSIGVHPIEEVKPVDSTQSVEDFTPQRENPYHQALSEPNAHFVYLTEEDYMEEDGRTKNQIIVLMDDERPLFLENGGEIRDWEDKIGEHILRDMYTMIPPGEPPVLYVRNMLTDEDYEVSRDNP
jgi:hypothetical protein